MMRRVDKNLYALYISSYATARALYLMPKTDLVDETLTLMLDQSHLLMDLLNDEESEFSVDEFIMDAERLADQVERLDAFQE